MKAKFPDAEVNIFGSFLTGACINSDVDLVVIIPSVNTVDQKEKELELLQQISTEVLNPNDTSVISKARIPLLESKSGAFPFDFDICVNRSLGLFNSLLLAGFSSWSFEV